ncbi:MAG: 16S rRNA processing protein RimM, partial [Candidatus Neoclostridium sp.]
MKENIVIGRVIKAVGIKGEIKVTPITDDMLRYKKLKTVYISGIPYQILSCRFDKAF